MREDFEPRSRSLEPLGQLEQALIDEFIRQRGYDPLNLSSLPENVRHELLIQASVFASGRLVEVEARSHFLHEIHGQTSKTGLH